jgi:hypothetical protein
VLELIKFLGDENDFVDFDRELTIDDFITPKMSAFARVMLESAQLKVRHVFYNHLIMTLLNHLPIE